MENNEILTLLKEINESVGVRDLTFASVAGALIRLESLVKAIERDLQKVTDSLDGNNGDGIKARLLIAVKDIGDLKGDRVAPGKMKEMLLSALIGAAFAFITSLIFFLLTKPHGTP